MMPKQRSRKVRIGEYVFDSGLEGERYLYLLGVYQGGGIDDFKPRPKSIEIAAFTILPKSALRPKKAIRQARVYTPDFSYTYQGITVIEDVKPAYSKTKKGRYKKGDPIVSEASRLRMRIVQGLHPDCVVVMVTSPSWFWGESGGHKLL